MRHYTSLDKDPYDIMKIYMITYRKKNYTNPCTIDMDYITFHFSNVPLSLNYPPVYHIALDH